MLLLLLLRKCRRRGEGLEAGGGEGAGVEELAVLGSHERLHFPLLGLGFRNHCREDAIREGRESEEALPERAEGRCLLPSWGGGELVKHREAGGKLKVVDWQVNNI